MTAPSPAVHVSIGDGPAAASLVACLIQAGIDCRSAAGKASRPTAPAATGRRQLRRASPEGVDQNYTYHVQRGLFDNLLLPHAYRVDAQLYEGVAATAVRNSGQRQRALRPAGNQIKWRIKDRIFDESTILRWINR